MKPLSSTKFKKELRALLVLPPALNFGETK
jgi:hypothetical protein